MVNATLLLDGDVRFREVVNTMHIYWIPILLTTGMSSNNKI